MTGRRPARIPSPKPDVDPSTYLSTKDLAKLLQISASTLRKLLVAGKMCSFIRIGQAIQVRRETFEKWAAQQEKDSMSQGIGWIGD